MTYLKYKNQNLFYQTTKPHKNEQTILLLPGNTVSSVSYERDIQKLQQGLQVISFDYLGTGKSGRYSENEFPGADYWIEAASQAAFLINSLELAPCLVLGTSGGAVAALLLAAGYPELVKAVIADSCVDFPPPEALQQEVRARMEMNPFQRTFWEANHGPDWQEVIKMENCTLRDLAARGGHFFGGQLSKITCPVLLTASKEDNSLPDVVNAQSRMQKTIPNCRVSLHEQGGHPLIWSQPEAFYKEFEGFLAEIL